MKPIFTKLNSLLKGQRKHEVLPLLLHLTKDLGADMYRYRSDSAHLYIRSVFQDTDYYQSGNEDFVRMVGEAIFLAHQEGIQWILSKKIVPSEVSLLLYKHQPSLMRIKSILEACKESEIELEDKTMNVIEDLITPVLEGLYKMEAREKRSNRERDIQTKEKINESFREVLEHEKIYL